MDSQSKTFNSRGREYLLKGEVQYYFRSAVFTIENLIFSITRQAILTRMSTVLSLPLQYGFPAQMLLTLKITGVILSFLVSSVTFKC